MAYSLSSMIRLQRPQPQSLPLVVAVPHAGRDYSPVFTGFSGLSQDQWRLTEDAYADELAALAPGKGAPLLAALFPRIWLDANRDANELDPQLIDGDLSQAEALPTANVRAGLGVVPRLLTGGHPIYAAPLKLDEVKARIDAAWRPYHQTLRELIEDTRMKFGRCLLVDCHTMPTGRESEPPDIVLGDGFGQTADPAIVGEASDFFQGHGFKVSLNRPYAGGYTTRHYGRPETGVMALQIEIRRGLYMDEKSLERHAGLSRLTALLGDLFERLGRIA